MARFLAKAALLAVPVILLSVVQLMLPLDAFCFRSWEALAVGYRTHDVVGLGPVRMPAITALPGPFVPRTRLERVEEGDLGHHTPFAVQRRVVWETDARGYRASPAGEPPVVVLVGDSNVVGSGLTQADTLAEVLRREHGIAAYPYAPEDIESYAADPSFAASPPPVVVLTCVERNVLDAFANVRQARPRASARDSAWLLASDMAVNRLNGSPLLGWVRAQVNGRRQPLVAGGMLFPMGARANATPDPGRVHDAAATVGHWARRLRERGTRLVLLIVPNKENTYADLFGPARSTLVSAMRNALHQEDVAVIDLDADFAAARAADDPPFQADDTHWSAVGVRVAARRIAELVGAEPSRVARP